MLCWSLWKRVKLILRNSERHWAASRPLSLLLYRPLPLSQSAFSNSDVPGILCFSTKSAFSTLLRYLSTLSPLLHFSICSPIKASLIQRIWAPDWQLIFLLNTLFLLSAKTKFQPLCPLPILEVYPVIQRKGEGADLEQFKRLKADLWSWRCGQRRRWFVGINFLKGMTAKILTRFRLNVRFLAHLF